MAVSQTFKKRERERARRERQAEKAKKKSERKLEQKAPVRNEAGNPNPADLFDAPVADCDIADKRRHARAVVNSSVL